MKKIVTFIVFILLVSFSCKTNITKVSPVQKNSTNSQKQPNILVIYTDDLGYHDLSSTGSILYDTPNIDGLADESVSFTNAYSNYPRCVPSRYAMMTGTYPVIERKGNMAMATINPSKNFIKQFTDAGYNSSYVGKWHLGKSDCNPKEFGFTHMYAAGQAGGIGSHFYPFNTQKNGKPAKYDVPNVKEDGVEGNYSTDMLTNATINFIKENPKDKPFLAVLAFYAVHTPIEAKKEDIVRNKKQLKEIDFGNTPEYVKQGAGRNKKRQDDPAYAGMVENVDENVGRLLKTLNMLGIADNTIIMFSSDHGGLSNDGFQGERHLATTNFPLKAGKGWLYEGGIRVPLFIKWANQLTPRKDNESIVLGMDMFPTLLDMSINKTVVGLDGKSYKDVLEGKDNWKDRTVYWHSSKARPHSTGDSKTSVVRSGDYKLVHFYEIDKVELYNLKEDIGEANDLSKKMPQKTLEMMKLLTDWKIEYAVAK